jgi:hypothetical protein
MNRTAIRCRHRATVRDRHAEARQRMVALRRIHLHQRRHPLEHLNIHTHTNTITSSNTCTHTLAELCPRSTRCPAVPTPTHPQAAHDATKHHVLPVPRRMALQTHKELAPIRVRPAVRHRQRPAIVRKRERLVREPTTTVAVHRPAVDALAAAPVAAIKVAAIKVAALHAAARQDAMERRALQVQLVRRHLRRALPPTTTPTTATQAITSGLG